MYVIQGYNNSKRNWYDSKNNKWSTSILEAEFFDDMNTPHNIISEFLYNTNNKVRVGVGRKQVVVATMMYIEIESYEDDDIAKQMLMQ